MRKKGREVVQLTLYEADNSDRMSSRSVIYYHNSNCINTIIVIIETNKFMFFCRPKWTQIAESRPTLYMPSDSKSTETPEPT